MAQGGTWRVLLSFIRGFAMGDWLTFDWERLDTPTLVHILSNVWRVLSSRLLARFPFSQSESVPVPGSSSPIGSFTVIGEPVDEGSFEPELLIPFRCPFSCRWCSNPCGRSVEGHRHLLLPVQAPTMRKRWKERAASKASRNAAANDEEASDLGSPIAKSECVSLPSFMVGADDGGVISSDDDGTMASGSKKKQRVEVVDVAEDGIASSFTSRPTKTAAPNPLFGAAVKNTELKQFAFPWEKDLWRRFLVQRTTTWLQFRSCNQVSTML